MTTVDIDDDFTLDQFLEEVKVKSARTLSAAKARLGQNEALCFWMREHRNEFIIPVRDMLKSMDLSKLPKGLIIYVDDRVSFTYKVPNTNIVIGDFI